MGSLLKNRERNAQANDWIQKRHSQHKPCHNQSSRSYHHEHTQGIET